MRKVDCNICDTKDIALNETIMIDGKVYCKSCFESTFPNQEDLENKSVVKEADPTVCSFCSKDFGDKELNKISTYPICADCEVSIKNKTFPTWVKAFLVGIVVIVVLSFVWNWKFYSAYSNIKDSNEFFINGEYAEASLLMKAASEKVPEVDDLKTISSYFHGIELMANDKSTEALVEFEKCKDQIPADYEIEKLIVQAKIGSTFDNKDYNGFLEASLQQLDMDPNLPVYLTSVASAYACLYAEKGDEEYKQNSLTYLNKSKQIDSTSEEMTTYYNMVDYRIDSRKIIEREEFMKQFPNGYHKK